MGNSFSWLLYPLDISPLFWGFLALWDFLPLQDVPRIHIFNRFQHLLKFKIYCFQPSKPEISKWPSYWWIWDEVIFKKLIELLVSSKSLSVCSVTSPAKACPTRQLFKPVRRQGLVRGQSSMEHFPGSSRPPRLQAQGWVRAAVVLS